VETGQFQMGAQDCLDDEKPIHTVHLDGFHIDQYETSNQLYADFLNGMQAASRLSIQDTTLTEGTVVRKVFVDGQHIFDLSAPWCQIVYSNGQFNSSPGKESYPVTVSWYGATLYAAQYGKRLPTEAGWEYAAKGGKLNGGYRYSGSNDAGSVAWHKDNCAGSSHPIGQKSPNQIGTYDMSGNLREWVSDLYDPNYYSTSPESNPQGPESPVLLPDGGYGGRVMRGGSWHEWQAEDVAVDRPLVRVTKRDYGCPCNWSDRTGFRCVAVVSPLNISCAKRGVTHPQVGYWPSDREYRDSIP
jgi:formylglycine-generating enzyme required for sulfatase activity